MDNSYSHSTAGDKVSLDVKQRLNVFTAHLFEAECGQSCHDADLLCGLLRVCDVVCSVVWYIVVPYRDG